MPDLRVNRARGGADRLLDIGNDLDRVVIPVFMSDQKQIGDRVGDRWIAPGHPSPARRRHIAERIDKNGIVPSSERER